MIAYEGAAHEVSSPGIAYRVRGSFIALTLHLRALADPT